MIRLKSQFITCLRVCSLVLTPYYTPWPWNFNSIQIFIFETRELLYKWTMPTWEPDKLSSISINFSSMFQLMPSDNCYNSLIQMLHCSSCNGFLNVKVCNNYCLNVMKECLLYHTEVDGEWNSFVGKHEYKYIIFLKKLHYCYDSSLLTISFLRGRHFLCKYILFQVLWEKQEWFVEC